MADGARREVPGVSAVLMGDAGRNRRLGVCLYIAERQTGYGFETAVLLIAADVAADGVGTDDIVPLPAGTSEIATAAISATATTAPLRITAGLPRLMTKACQMPPRLIPPDAASSR